jgi:hypothetical protein
VALNVCFSYSDTLFLFKSATQSAGLISNKNVFSGHTEFENSTFLDKRPDESAWPLPNNPIPILLGQRGARNDDFFYLNLRPNWDLKWRTN